MPTPHIEANIGDIKKNVLMPGDPVRAKYIADNYLTDVKVVNTVRNMIAYTGKYKGVDVTIFPSGMGIPSMGIYSYELFKIYDVDKIIRIGTSGSNREDVKVLDVVLAESSYSLSTFADVFDSFKEKEIYSDKSLNEIIYNNSKELNIDLKYGKIITSDVFNVYVDDQELYMNKYPKELNSLASEMEAFALFFMAKKFNKKASCLLTVVDSPFDDRVISSEDRATSLDNMIKLALESIIK